MTLQILYLAHDLADAAIRRRVLMLKHGGARVTVAGFQRAGNVLADDADVRTISLGRTSDGRFAQRIGAVVTASLNLKRQLSDVGRPDVIIARNLEMLALAARASAVFGPDVPVVYECLDIHRLLLDEGLKGKALRAVEGHFGRNAQLLITSSPAFIEHYFARRSQLRLPSMLLENKVLALDGQVGTTLPQPRPPELGEPWKIGWFGAIRCRKSLSILSEFAARMDGRVKVVLRGRPAHSEFEDFDRQVEMAPHVEFLGPYRNPEELDEIYSDIQFVWAIDFFEEGLNSEWLLPNRLYEGSLHGAVPIALKSTETGGFLAQRGLGLRLDRAHPDDLVSLFEAMDRRRYGELFDSIAATERDVWLAGREDCRALVARLAALNTRPITDMASATVSPVRS
ncbi:glycosyl transferase family 1 [Neorhizobium sp. T786]|uniref:glycosyltransferase n=1 Tax=Pseudorhizobium xiangyangii TaxID=2883104 RepID=UPI001CFFADA6|nr:glycosyltransferase [Neorhizobium xiangyangii]MCB5204878.1 glycosyl transferase family 1 [Neorhizobium xiangyangii]